MTIFASTRMTVIAVAWLLIAPGLGARSQPTICKDPGGFNFGASESITNDDMGLTLRGKAWLCFNGNLLMASVIRSDRRTRRVSAEGGVQLHHPDGTVIQAEKMEFSEILK